MPYASEFRVHLGTYLEQMHRAPVLIERHRQVIAALIPYEQLAHFQRLDATCALMAEELRLLREQVAAQGEPEKDA